MGKRYTIIAKTQQRYASGIIIKENVTYEISFIKGDRAQVIARVREGWGKIDTIVMPVNELESVKYKTNHVEAAKIMRSVLKHGGEIKLIEPCYDW